MPKLKSLRPALAALPPRLRRPTDAEGHDRRAEYWRGWYSLKRWRDLRLATFVRDLFTCQEPSCRRIEPDTSQLVADHIRPHRGDERLFWDPTNLQTLCATCHNRLKQAAERAAAPW